MKLSVKIVCTVVPSTARHKLLALVIGDKWMIEVMHTTEDGALLMVSKNPNIHIERIECFFDVGTLCHD